MTIREPEQFTLDREEMIRKDLEGKISALDQKYDVKISTLSQEINKKVSNGVFYSLITILLAIVAGIIGYAFFLINQLDSITNQLNVSQARVETKIDMKNKKS